jgi:very-short-patch-repair endonuclease
VKSFKKLWENVTFVIGLIIGVPIFVALGIEVPLFGLAIVGFFGILYLVDKKHERAQKNQQEEKRKLAEEQLVCQRTLKAAELGDVNAAYDYGLRLLNGRGCEADPDVGICWLVDAADGGVMCAQEFVGASYEQGRNGLNKDLEMALHYYRMALMSGSKSAASNISSIERQTAYKQREADKRGILTSSNDWSIFERFLLLCDSEPERLLLKALIVVTDLKPDGKWLQGRLRVLPQARLLRFRVDFLVNEHLVVEVDGKAFHNSSQSFESDRRRDQELVLAGYKTIRFPASQVFNSPLEVAEIVFRAAEVKLADLS